MLRPLNTALDEEAIGHVQPSEHRMAAVVSNGQRKHRRQTFNIQMEGVCVHTLLELLRSLAVGSQNYVIVQECVELERNIWAQVKQQGF